MVSERTTASSAAEQSIGPERLAQLLEEEEHAGQRRVERAGQARRRARGR